jgi:hypothetical protein
MHLTKWRFLLGLAAALLLAPNLPAQRSPNIGYIYPAGGRQGATFQAVLSGQFLDGPTNVLISGEGVQATIVEYAKPLNGRQLLLLQDRLRNLRQGLSAAKKTNTTVFVLSEFNTNEVREIGRALAEAEVADLRQKLDNPKNRRPPNPQLGEDVKLKITVAPNAPPGERELRLLTAAGLSNPRVFRVDQLPEFSKKAEISLSGPRNANQPRSARRSNNNSPEKGLRITLPAQVNGQVMPGGVDRYEFTARRGVRLVAAVNARSLIPYIADAVPGWFQATLALYDSKGKELAYADDFRFNPDPVLYYEIPLDGDYALEIKDAIYRGREDFVYRITVGEVPFLTSIFPLGGKAGEQTTVEVKGWNLPTNTLVMDAKNKGPGAYPLSVRQEERVSNPVPFAVDALPEALEQEPNNSPERAQPVTLPIIVNGRIDPPDDRDVFRFEGRAGDQVVAEVYARRLNSPLDSMLKLTDAAGHQLAFNDDYEDKGAGLTTHHADSRLQFTLPATGTCYLHLGDTQGHGGPEYGYRLRLSPPQPDFELRVVPASVNVRAGASVPLTVYALRKDGFTNEVSVVLKDAPQGFSLGSSRIPTTTNQARITLIAPQRALGEPVSLSLEGSAMIAGQKIVHPAVPAEDMMQAFAYRHLVPAKNLEVAVLPRAGGGRFNGPGRRK